MPLRSQIRRFVPFGLSLALGVSCSSVSPPCGECDGHYALSVNAKGQALVDGPPGKGPIAASQAQYDEELDKMERGILAGRKRRIVVFIHGGLVGLNKSSEESLKLAEYIKSTDPSIYPVFVNWDTGLFSSYGRHLLADDAGVSYESKATANAGRWALGPLNLVGDIGMGISRLPVNSLRASARFFGRNRNLPEWQPNAYPANYSFARKLDEGLGVRYVNYRGVEPQAEQYMKGFYRPFARRSNFPFHVSLGPDRVHGISERDLTILGWFLPKNGTLIFAEGLGRGAWDNMVLRARLITHSHREFFLRPPNGTTPIELPNRGPGLVLIERLNHIAKRHGLDLELYGHSMGVIVLNSIIDELARPGHERELELKRLVYMAGACRINDFRRTAGRYIDATRTDFYNLCLHPTQEVRENLWDDVGSPLISGSLLTWIDSMFERPPSFGDRTLGSYANCVLAEGLMPHGKHVRLKGFGADFRPVRQGGFFNRDNNSDLGPQKHGEFNEFQFWEDDYLDPQILDNLNRLRVP